MQLVIDYNVLGSESLKSFFSESRRNVGIVTDMLDTESLKRDGIGNYRKSYEVLSKYPDQIYVLKEYSTLRMMTPQKVDVMMNMVDLEATAAFPKFCKTILHSSDPQVIAQIVNKQIRTRKFMDFILKLGDELRTSITEAKANLPKARLSKWAQGKPITNDEIRYVIRETIALTKAQYELTFPGRPPPHVTDFPYWIHTRYIVTLQSLVLKYLRDGWTGTISAKKLRNDSVDIYYAAYGTLFDGILTDDVRLREIYQIARQVLKDGFNVG